MKYCYIIVLAFLGCQQEIEISENTREGAEVFVIKTDHALYEYEKKAGGFRSIIDSEGRDWIQFSATDSAYYPASAASDYRGLPNLVFRSEDGGAGHPGFEKMTSEIIAANQIRSTSLSGKWSWTWTFYPDYAELKINQIDPDTPYWFLYEGPVAGEFNPSTHLWGTNVEGPMYSEPDLVKGSEIYGHWQTAYFGDRNYSNTLFVHQRSPDARTDMFAYMGNSLTGNRSENGMAVFGFGRDKNAVALMNQKNTFIIGIYPSPVTDQASHRRILKYINQL